MRKLASIQKIVALDPIEGADNIEVATVQAWQVVVRKGEFKVDDLCVYFEIDSILPDEPWAEFMRSRKFRVKTIKLRGQISQGLALPLPNDGRGFKEGEDVTSIYGVTKHDPQRKKELAAHKQTKRVVPHSWMLRWRIGRYVHQKLYPRASGSFPGWFPKTDETRVQNIPNIIGHCAGRYLYMMEKLDGQSVSLFFKRDEKVGLFATGLFGVCSRNIWYKNPADNNWWNIAKQYKIDEGLENYCREYNRSLCIQGEIVGEGIQGNRYNIKGKELHVFSIYDIDEDRYLKLEEKIPICIYLGLDHVPVLMPEVLVPKDRIHADWLKLAEGKSVLNQFYKWSDHPDKYVSDIEREGIVIRDYEDDGFSFKAISNKFLLEGGE